MQGRAVHNGRSGWVRRHLHKDQVKHNSKPLKLRKNIEVRWLSLYQSIIRDIELQHTILRLYNKKSIMYQSSDKKKRLVIDKLIPSEDQYELLSQFAGVLKECQECCLLLQRSHVSLGEAQSLVIELKYKMSSDSSHKFACPIIKEDVVQGRVINHKNLTFKDLHYGVQRFCILLEASLCVRFPEWPSAATMLSSFTDPRWVFVIS